MPWCGYHPMMEAAVQQFGIGLAEAIRIRAQEFAKSNYGGKALEAQVSETERRELRQLSGALAVHCGGPHKMALEGLTNFVRGIVEGAALRTEKENCSFYEAIKKEAAEIGALILPMEEQSKKRSAFQEMDDLAAWVAKQ